MPEFFLRMGISGGGCPLVSFPMPLYDDKYRDSIEYRDTLLDTYRGRNFRYRPALVFS